MSFMPNYGTIVKMIDGRVAIVTGLLSGDDRVLFADGHEEETDAWKLQQSLSNEDEPPPSTPADYLTKLREFLHEPRAVDVHLDEYSADITLSGGGRIVVRWDSVSRLANATKEERWHWELIGGGIGVRWPLVDEDLSISRLLGLECK